MRGLFISGSARYTLGDIVSDNTGRLFILIAGFLSNSVTQPSADPTNWIPLNQLPASLAEVNVGLNNDKYITPLTLKQRLGTFSDGGTTAVDMTGQIYLRLETDGQTFGGDTRQINKTQTERRDIVLSGVASNDANAIRLIVSTQGQSASYWDGVNFTISNGTDTDIGNFAIANGTGNGGVISDSNVNIITIPSKRRAIVRVSASSTPGSAVNGLTMNIKLLDGTAGGSTDFATEAETKALTAENKAISPATLEDVLEKFARKDGTLERSKMPHVRIEDAKLWVDNGGNIEETEGFDNMALIYKTQTGIGRDFPEWVNTSIDNVFTLDSAQIGTGPNAQHN